MNIYNMKNVLLINSQLRDLSFLLSTVKSDVTCVVFDTEVDTNESLLQKIPLGVSRVGIAQHNLFREHYPWLGSSENLGEFLIQNVATEDPSLESWSSFRQFLHSLKEMGMKHLDLIECNLGSPDWRFITQSLEQSLSIEIHYSTGVIGKNGTWILETDPTVHTDDTVLVGTYFTENVRYYPYPLGASGPFVQIEPYNYDGYYQSISMSYKTVTMEKTVTNPDFRLDLTINKLVGKVSFRYDFYEDVNLTTPSEVPYSNPYILKEGVNTFSASNTVGSTTRFAVGRLSFLPGSRIELSSFIIEGTEQITSSSVSDSLTIDAPPLTFVESLVDRIYYRSMSFQEIKNDDFQVEMTVDSTVGGVLFGYKHSNSPNLIASTSIVSGNYTVKHGAVVPGESVTGQFVFTPGSSIVLSSFKVNGVEQLLNGPVAFETREPVIDPEQVLKSEICFLAGTLVKTDQGLVEIQKLNKKIHTLQGKSIVSVTETYCLDDELVKIEKDALRKNYPNKDTIITKRHKIYYHGKMKSAQRFVGKFVGVTLIPYQEEKLYNVLLEDYGKMSIHGMMCETLHPTNPIAKLYKSDLVVPGWRRYKIDEVLTQ